MSSRRLELERLVRIRDADGLRVLLVTETTALGGDLGVGVSEIERIATLDDDALVARLDRLVRWRREQASNQRDAELSTESTVAVLRLIESAGFHDDGVHLDVSLLLGPVLSARSSHVAFHVDDVEVAVERSRLIAARRVLRPFTDVTARVDPGALRLGWRRGRGGLVFRPQVIARDQRDRVLHIVLAPPVSAAALPAPMVMPSARPRPRPGSWLVELLSALGSHL
jgi:hypothetical protein